MKAVGIDHEHHVARRLQAASAVSPNSMEEGVAWLGESPETHEAVWAAGDNLKSLLLQLTAAEGLPSSLKDSVQQALQQVTGQQLLLASDRQSAFTHVTILLPFRDGNGDQTAAVHVQSRKGPRGNWIPPIAGLFLICR
ncbi:OPI10 family protein [Paenibacillus sp. CC-CFT747]|nr:OPI10 family protein [Paenibacillus sp. CC-CFT747]